MRLMGISFDLRSEADPRGATVLWSVRSPCNLGCKYCYFGTVDEHLTTGIPVGPGEMSHLRRDDVRWDSARDFPLSFADQVRRVFLVGGEPLLWHHITPLLETLATTSAEVVAVTNGLPLAHRRVRDLLFRTGVAAVSVSLDSNDSVYNDHWRPDPSGRGFAGVVDGISQLLRERPDGGGPKVGLYTVLTKRNVAHMAAMADFVADLGVDYWVTQPVSLEPSDPYHGELSFVSEADTARLRDALAAIDARKLPYYAPPATYHKMIPLTVVSPPAVTVQGCFGGRDLFFVEPDGSVWDCPSFYKHRATPASEYRSILTSPATDLFGPERRSRSTDCGQFSADCVSMWQLMAFDEILRPEVARGSSHHWPHAAL